jgi:hypothetical protein
MDTSSFDQCAPDTSFSPPYLAIVLLEITSFFLYKWGSKWKTRKGQAYSMFNRKRNLNHLIKFCLKANISSFYGNIESILKLIDIYYIHIQKYFWSKLSKHESIRITSTLFRECIQT